MTILHYLRGVYVSRGGTWTAQNDGLDFRNIGALAVGRERVYAGTLGGGVYAGRIHPDFSITWSASMRGVSSTPF